MGLKMTFGRRAAWLTTLAALLPLVPNSGGAEPTRAVRAWPVVGEQITLPRPRPDAGEAEAASGADIAADRVALPEGFRELAKRPGEPQIPGLTIVYLHLLGLPGDAVKWRNIIVHQTEGPPGSAKGMALAQAKNPTRRGVTIWVETDG
ncbi:MAG: hypothetical protein ACJ8FA_06735, partial [Xanthobacteraceae bacterium]